MIRFGTLLPILTCSLPCSLLAAAPARGAELKILEPRDRTLVRGTIQFRIQPVHAPEDQFLSNPEITIQDEYGKTLHRLRAARDPKTQVCSVGFDTRQLRDGLLLAAISYRTLVGGTEPKEIREDLTLGVRNGTSVRPGGFTVEMESRDYKVGELCDLTVRVLDQNRRRMPGARITFRVDRGEADTEAEITDSSGEAFASVTSEEGQIITLTITVENLPPVTRVFRFVE